MDAPQLPTTGPTLVSTAWAGLLLTGVAVLFTGCGIVLLSRLRRDDSR